MTPRHGGSGTDVRVRFGGLLAGILTLCVTLLGIGILMTGSFFGHRRPAAPVAHQTADAAAPAAIYSGPLPTGMVGLVTVGAQAVGVGAPLSSMPGPSTSASRPTATTSVIPGTSTGATPLAPATGPDPMTTQTSQQNAGVQPAATSASPTPMPTFTWPYQWPSWHPGG